MSVTQHPDYASLPEALKATFSPEDYAAMPDEDRKRLLEDATMPEVVED